MKNAAKQYNFTKKELALKRYSSWFKEADSGSLNGFTDIRNMGLRDSRSKIVPQNKSGEKPLHLCSKEFSLLGRSWNLTRLADLSSLALGRRLSSGSLNKERFVMPLLSLQYPEYLLVTAKQARLNQKETAISSLILILRQRRWETSIRQTLWDPDISEVQRGLPDSIPFILWMWEGIQFPPASFLTNRPSPFLSISSKHGNIWGFPEYPRWITRWQLLAEDATPTVSPSLSDSICLWEYIWYSSHRESQVEMPLLKVLMTSGKRESLEDITVLPLALLKELMSDSCGIITMRNLTEGLLKKSMAQDSPACLETNSGNISNTFRKGSALRNIVMLMVTLHSRSPEEKSPLSEKLILMVKLMLMVLLISLKKDLRGNMLLLLSSLIERDWLLNKTIRLSSLSLFQLRVIFLLLYFHIQRGKLNLVSDVMRFLSIRNQLAML